MILKLLGWVWIISGIIFFMKPTWLKKRLQKSTIKKVRKVFFLIALAVGLLLIKAGWGIPGFGAKLVVLFGLISIFKACYFLKAKSAEKLIDWYTNLPLKSLRLYAAAQVVFGAILLSI